MTLLALDSRWRRFNDESRACPCCGKHFNGIFDIGMDHPDSWPHGSRVDSGQDELVIGDDKLSSDLCRHDDFRFIRCVLSLPLRGSDEVFSFGVWASVHPDNFYRYIEDATGEKPGFEGCFAWMMNTLPLFESDDPIGCDLIPGEPEMRPSLQVQDGPLAQAQSNGITFDDLLDIYAASGTDIRPHLTQD